MEKVYLNLEDIVSGKKFVSTWMHEQAHHVIQQTVSQDELSKIFDENSEFVQSVIPLDAYKLKV